MSEEEHQELTVEVRTSALPRPNIRFHANWARAIEDEQGVVLQFGNVAHGNKCVSSLVEVLYDWEAYRSFALRNGQFAAAVAKQVENLGRAPASASPDLNFERANVLTFGATVDRMSFLGLAGEIDFYYASPNGYQNWKATKQSNPNADISETVVAVCCVTMSCQLLSLLLQQALAIKAG